MTRFQVIVPMSGFGERFRRVGYSVPKPLIEIDGKPIVHHVVDMFPGVADIIFICNREHLETLEYAMCDKLLAACPSAKIVGIEPQRLGPVNAVLEAAKQNCVDLERPTIINYCDFSCYWNFDHFQQWVTDNGCDGAIPAYTGFHPHMLDSTNYAYVRHKQGWVQDIQEKQPYTDNPSQEYASSGTYYFKSGGLALEACRRCKEQDYNLNGEFYVSLAYKPLLNDNCRIGIYPLQHFMQWGTPQDLEEYRDWSNAFRHLGTTSSQDQAKQAGTVMIPMAGTGSRFVAEGYELPKPLIPISGKAMVVQAAQDLPRAEYLQFIVRDDLPKIDQISEHLEASFINKKLVSLQELTQGQAITCLAGAAQCDADQPLSIGACDNGILYDAQAFELLMSNPDIDVIVWGKSNYQNAKRKPQMYGWIDTGQTSGNGAEIKAISVKKPLSGQANEPVIVGAFSFKRTSDFVTAANAMIARDGRVNGEFYVDELINDCVAAGLKCVLLEVDAFLCWGTPDELRTFEYWQSCFHKWASHPYRLENDRRVASDSVKALEARFAPILPSTICHQLS